MSKILAFAQTTITKVNDGANAKSLDLSSTKYAIAFNKDNVAKDSTDITLTAKQQNDSTALTWTTTPNVTLNGSGNTRTLAVSNFTNNNQIQIKVTAGSLSDTVTIVKIKDGSNGSNGANGNDAYTIVLSNEAQTIATNTNLQPLSATTYNCKIAVYKGTTALTPTTAASTEANQFKVILPSNPTGITLGQVTAGTVTFTTNTSTAIAVNGTINLSIQINGVAQAISKTISYSASKQGNTGATGGQGPQGPQGPQGEALDIYDGTFSEGKRF